MGQDKRPRDEKGQLAESPNSLYPRVIGVRVSKASYPKLIALAEAKNLRPTELARQAIEEYVQHHQDKP